MFLIVLGLPVFAQTPADIAAVQDSRPNVLILYTDEHRFDCLGAMGNAEIETPHLDALAADGVLYRNSFCVWPVCTPSRLSLLTGQYVHQHGGRSNRSTLPPAIPTFATILRDAGYQTAAVGKMHFTPAYQDVGFSEMVLAEQNGRGRNVDDYHRYLKDKDLINANDLIDQERQYRQMAPEEYWETSGAQVSDLPDEHHITTWVANRAVSAVSNWETSSPNLLMVGFLKPHHPFDPPAPWDEYYDPKDMSLLPGWTDSVPAHDLARGRGYFNNPTLTREALQRVTAYYYATITHVDHHVGRIIEELKRRKLYDDTLIVFTSDHGEYLGFHHMLTKGNHMYDPLAKVPLIIKFPRQRFNGRVSDDLVNTLDVTATILSEAGESLAPDMRGSRLGEAGPGHEDARTWVIAQDTRSIMVRSHERKLILDQDPARSMFFDLSKDPYELTNRIDDPNYAEELASFKEAALSWFLNEWRRSTFVDEEVPLAEASDIPRDLDAAEREMLEYFERKMKPKAH